MATLELWIEGIEPALSVRRFEIREGVSELFTVAIVACSPRPDLDWDEAILRPASFSIDAGWAFVQNGGSRIYTGVCASFEQIQAEPSGLSTYSIRLAPRLWLLTEREDYRIFQHVTIPDIVTGLLERLSIAHRWRIDRDAFPKLEYKVQYGESDFAFLCRLCEEAGLTFTFEHDDEERESVLLLTDAPGASPLRTGSPLPYVDNPSQAAEREFITRVRVSREGRAGAVTLRDYDFRSPGLPLYAQASRTDGVEGSLEKFRYEPGAFRREAEATTSTPMADRAGVARHDPRYGQGHAERTLLGSRATALRVGFETNALDLAPGTVFSIAGHPHPKLDESKRLLVTQLALEGEHDKTWTTMAKAVFAEPAYQPPRTTKKPLVHGTQPAALLSARERDEDGMAEPDDAREQWVQRDQL